VYIARPLIALSLFTAHATGVVELLVVDPVLHAEAPGCLLQRDRLDLGDAAITSISANLTDSASCSQMSSFRNATSTPGSSVADTCTARRVPGPGTATP
jgi:hypothetical protein